MHSLIQCAIVCLAMLCETTAWAATLTVGSGQQYSSLQSAVSAARAGDTVLVYGGTYAPITISNSGASGAPITIKAAAGQHPKITATSSTTGVMIVSSSGSTHSIGWIDIEGLDITGGLNGIKAYNVNNLVVRGNHVHDNPGQGLLINGSLYVTIDRNIIERNGSASTGNQVHGIYATGNYWTVTNNVFNANGGYGLQIAGYSTTDLSYLIPSYSLSNHWVVANNTFAYQINRAGIVVWCGYTGSCNDVQIFNNLFYHNAEGAGGSAPSGVNVSTSASNVSIHNNMYYGSVQFLYGSTFTASNNTNADPLFVSASTGNFQLQSNSPAIDRGTTTGAPAYDLLGIPRPQGAGIDIGAYEYHSSTVTSSPTPAPSPAPVTSTTGVTLTVNPNPLIFPNQTVGTTSAIMYVTVKNTGTSDLKFTALFGLTGDFSFGGVGTCGLYRTVSPGATCTVSLKFTPTAKGARTGTLTLHDNATTGGGTQSVSLSGYGI